MAINRDALLQWPFEPVEHTYTLRDTMLYALGLGFGADPMDIQQLRFVYEEQLQTLPVMAVVLGSPGFWLRDPRSGVDWKKVLHGAQGFQVFKSLPAASTVIGRTRIVDIIDKGAGKGAIMLSERDVTDKATGDLLCRLTSTTMLRGDGGFANADASPARTMLEPHKIPERAADITCRLPTAANAALIYRLSGDYNPLHADPAVARAAGFEKPILHGLCTFGVVAHALIKSVCAYDANRLTAMDARFSAPVYPGETIVTEIWRDADTVSFRASVAERGTVVLNNGRAMVAPH